MTTYLPYEASVSRVDDRIRAARVRHAEPARSRTVAAGIVRHARAADREALDRLAALDSARRLVGEALIAQVGDEPVAAIELATGRVVADPFRPTVHLVEALQQRAERVEEQAAPRRRLRFVPRFA